MTKTPEDKDSEKRDEVLKRMLGTKPAPSPKPDQRPTKGKAQ